MKNILLIPLLGALFINNLSAQIYFQNPSFEKINGSWQDNGMPFHWKSCSESPDLLPCPTCGDLALPLVGDSYIGIVSISDWFVESFSQTLDTVLLPHQDYYFSIYANAMSNYPLDTIIPNSFSVWIGRDSCTHQQKIYTSPDIPYHGGWIEYVINFTPNDTINTILFSGDTLSNGTNTFYIGLDNLSPIYEGYQPPLGTPIVQAGKEIAVSPNPSTGFYYINQSSDAPLLVYDINGQLLQHYAPHTAQIDLSHLAAGLYILSIGTDKQRLIKL